MNCLEFEKNVIDLAKGVSLSSESNQHAQECPRCAIRWRNVGVLKDALTRVASADRTAMPPPHLEAALLSAFRQQHQEKLVPVAGWFDLLSAFFGQLKWGLVTAAVLILLGMAVARMTVDAPQQIVERSPVPAPSAAASVPEPDVVTGTAPQYEENRVAHSPINPMKAVLAQVKSRNNFQGKSNSSVSVEVGDFEVMEPEKPLLAKDFIPFDFAETMPPADNLQLMRVRMPREKLEGLGLSLPRRKVQSGFINADLLIGSDGVPRAINTVSLR